MRRHRGDRPPQFHTWHKDCQVVQGRHAERRDGENFHLPAEAIQRLVALHQVGGADGRPRHSVTQPELTDTNVSLTRWGPTRGKWRRSSTWFQLRKQRNTPLDERARSRNRCRSQSKTLAGFVLFVFFSDTFSCTLPTNKSRLVKRFVLFVSYLKSQLWQFFSGREQLTQPLKTDEAPRFCVYILDDTS